MQSNERFDPARQAEHLLTRLIGVETVPITIQEEARSILRRYPSGYDMQVAAKNTPAAFQEQLAPLYEMVDEYEQTTKEKL